MTVNTLTRLCMNIMTFVQEVNAVVTSISNVRHNLEVGDCVTFTGVSGTMSELADDKYLVTDGQLFNYVILLLV